jgi:hypothetical protein
MPKHNQPPISFESQWYTVAEFSLRGEAGCEHQAAERTAGILVNLRVPDQVLLEAKQAVSRSIEKELSRMVANQAPRTFTILLRAQPAQIAEVPALDGGPEELKARAKGWGFFLTERNLLETELGNEVHRFVISVYLYHEGLRRGQ